jgi:GMP synthase (glutamine-hydrolysing)
VPLLILVAGNTVPAIAARRGEFAQWIRETAGDAWTGGWVEHDLRTGASLPGVRDVHGVIVTGSASSVTERAPWMLRAEEYLRALVAEGVPVFGICFGHQMLAEALGGHVTKNPKGREIGTVRVERAGDDAIFRGVPPSFDASATHVDSVARLPQGARVLASTKLDPTAAFAVGARTRAVQFHPEIDADAMRGYVEARRGILKDEGLDPDAIHASIREAPHAEEVLRNFVRDIGTGPRETR